MPPFFWFLLCAYLLVAAGALLEIEISRADDAPAAGLMASCSLALAYAAAWPARALKALFERARTGG